MALTYPIHIHSKTFSNESTPVIRDLEVALPGGEFVSLLGPSGAGKSTFLNILAGLDKDFEGNAALKQENGQPARISLMFQEPRLMPWLTICDNIMLVCEGTKTQRKHQALHWLQQVGLSGAENQYPAQLSGGMLKRAALARAFAYEPDVLLMDEPFSSLDIPAADSLRALLTQLHQARRITVVYVTHDINEALMLSDRILLLSSHPMQIIRDVAITEPHPRNVQSPALLALSQGFKQALTHPA
ncbi:ABC transporter ATP-binding protein [Alteromonas lipolytica]|uniref:ABC transporter domain-containing protein n=1 Tax=Alteromonas lipolytica TaxID=1856405 RepID=A0A1E8FBZ3_9ALTE|nr:ABC transporter ATP-binding protein [Alteromonas lipolytica]OFI33430.1 hypothetical protein BFC17_04000 [Alteromonas lipolytica]GGF59757.1 nitrate/sulfonate/bicarbonate ABC transporter ATP-binding protein [Alteromonas lipolytica]